MTENIAQNKYSNVVDSYTALNVSSNIKGELIEKDGKNIKIDIGNDKTLEIELKEDVDIKKGDTIIIDRRNISKSKVVNFKEDIRIENGEVDIYSEKLKSLDIEINEENIKIIKKLENYGIDITKENFETYLIAKGSLDEISTSLDYESAIRLIEMDVDVENESIQKLASLIEELEEEKEGFKILDLFKKKELTTEEAESIAKDLYGSKMGKDIVDIIKSLHKKKVNITKRNIEKINDVFYKLDKLKDIEDKTFVDTIKNKLDINIDNLYKVKRYVKDGSVSMELGVVDSNRIVNVKGYEILEPSKPRVTSRELKLLEEDIEDLMIELELEPSEENIKISKEFIKRDMSVTKENIVSIDEMKKALEVIIKNLDKETASQIIKENVDIETTDIRIIADKIKTIKNPDELPEIKLENNDLEPKSEKDQYSQEIKESNQELEKVIEDKVSQTNLEEVVELEIKEDLYVKQKSEALESQVSEDSQQESIEELMKKIESLTKVEEKDILTLLEKNVDFKINKIEQVIFGKREAIIIDKIEDITYSKEITRATLDGIDKISTAFNEIGKLDFNTIAFQMKRNIPMTIMNMQKGSRLSENIDNKEQMQGSNQEDEITTATQALNRNGLDATRLNIQRSMEAYRNYNNIRENLTSNMVKQAVVNNVSIENMDINVASKYVDEYSKFNVEYQAIEKSIGQTDIKEQAQTFTDSAYQIIKSSDENIMFLMKNKKPLSLKELKDTNSMFRNQDQIGHKIAEITEYVNENGNQGTKEKFEHLKKEIMEFTKSLKGSNDDVEEAYKRLEESLKDIEENIELLNQDSDSIMRKKSKEISEKIFESKIIAKENEIIQFPLYMNGQFTNLNMYFRDKQREGSKKDSEDISVVLSIDTVNMGNININLDIEKKNINIKIGLEDINDSSHIESHKDMLEELLEQGGYSVGEITFVGEAEVDILGLEEPAKANPKVSNGNLDITV